MRTMCTGISTLLGLNSTLDLETTFLWALERLGTREGNVRPVVDGDIDVEETIV